MTRLGAVLLVLASASCTSAPLPRSDAEALEPKAGLPRGGQLRAGGVSAYRVDLAAGQLLRAEVTQQGVDVGVTVSGPDGEVLTDVDGISSPIGTEHFEFAATTSGAHRIEIRPGRSADPSASGSYSLWVKQVLSPEQTARLTVIRDREAAAVEWISDHAVRLRTAEAGNGFEDMQPLRAIVGDARVVALGEATHGTREFFQLKHRMLEFLVSEMGFDVFGIEATMPQSFAVNRYVLTGEGDPAAALQSLGFWTWSTEEVLDQIEWMRRYNADPSHERKVKFYGFDMQSLPPAIRVVVEYLSEVDPEGAAGPIETLAPLRRPFIANALAGRSTASGDELAQAVAEALHLFDEHRTEYVARTGLERWAIARRHGEVAAQNLASAAMPMYPVRDSAMAANALWILDHEGPDAKMVVWAHNGHVTHRPPAMGSRLRDALGSDMVGFGFAFDRGSFRARDAETLAGPYVYSVGAAKDGSLPAALHAAGLGIAALDLRAVPAEGPVADWWSAARPTRMIGAVFGSQSEFAFYTDVSASSDFDALLFVDSTTASRPLTGPGAVSAAKETHTEPGDLDFERARPGEPPVGWFRAFRVGYPYDRSSESLASFGLEIVAGDSEPYQGSVSAMISHPEGTRGGEGAGVLGQRVGAQDYRGRTVRIRAALRAELAPNGHAYLFLADPLRAIEVAEVPPGATDWREYEVVTHLAPDAAAIEYGLALEGDGRAWIDAVSVEALD